MQSFLKKNDLTTVYQPEFAYFWNINGSFNKSDGFLHKEIQITNEQGNSIAASENNKLDISQLSKGKYTIKILYTFDVPKTYQDEMLRLQNKYNITMTDREKYILVLQPNSSDPATPLQRWQTREVIYLPSHWKIGEISGDAYQVKKFTTEFSQGVSYLSKIVENPHTNEVKIQITIP